MRIRTRLTLWYAAILFVSALAVGGAGYKHFRDERRPQLQGVGLSEFLREELESWDDLVSIGLWCGLPAAVIGLAGGWLLTKQALAPVSRLIAAAEKIHEANLGEQIARTHSGDELDRLTEVFNEMSARLAGSFARMRDFMLHASHELKTPLTILRGEMETVTRQENVARAERERLQSQLEEVDRLAKIVDSLTVLTKAGAGQLPLKLEPVQLHELVREALEDGELLAEPAGVQLALGECEPSTVDADRHRLRQLLLNLLDNAIKYNRPGGRVDVALRRSGAWAELRVTNTGPGVSPEKLPFVFEPFFRGDESHSKDKEGCGLGLSIARGIVEAHRGTIRMSSDQNATVVTVQLKLGRTGDRV